MVFERRFVRPRRQLGSGRSGRNVFLEGGKREGRVYSLSGGDGRCVGM